MKWIFIAHLYYFLFTGYTNQQVWVKAKMPEKVYAGDKFTIEITINKLDLQHFAEYKQVLPAGFVPKVKKSGGADYSFKNNTVKYTWLRLPPEQKVTVSYEVQINENIKGKYTLPGQFVYFYKNQRGNATINENMIQVFSKGEKLSK